MTSVPAPDPIHASANQSVHPMDGRRVFGPYRVRSAGAYRSRRGSGVTPPTERITMTTVRQLPDTRRFSGCTAIVTAADGRTRILALSLIHISEPTRRTPISYAVFC